MNLIKYKKYKVQKIKVDIDKYNHILSTISIQLNQKLNDYFFDNHDDWYNENYSTLVENLEKLVKDKNIGDTAKLIHYFYKQSKDLENHIKGYEILYQENNEYQVKMETVRLKKALMHQSASFKSDFESIGVVLKVNNIDEGERVNVDKTLFSLIMYNFFDNAKKYVKPSSEIRFNYSGSDGVLNISMYSVKMEKVEVINLFNEGIRGMHANEMSSSGNGIGLSVIKKALRLMNMKNMYINCEYAKMEENNGIKFYENHFIFYLKKI